jgi:hypothetical protein
MFWVHLSSSRTVRRAQFVAAQLVAAQFVAVTYSSSPLQFVAAHLVATQFVASTFRRGTFRRRRSFLKGLFRKTNLTSVEMI